MTKPLIVSFPHSLGRQEAETRIRKGIDKAREKLTGHIQIASETWNGPVYDVDVRAMGQSVTATIEVADDNVTATVNLPWMLNLFRDKAKAQLEKRAEKLLT